MAKIHSNLGAINEYLLRVAQAIAKNISNKKEAIMASELVFRVSKELRAFIGITQ